MNTFERAFKFWGKERQMLQAIEEMSELTKEILKNINRQKDNIDELVEETADVEIMLEQLKLCYNITNRVAEYKISKLKEIDQRLDELENRK